MAALAPAFLSLTAALLGVYGGARLAQHDATAAEQRPWRPDTAGAPWALASILPLRAPAAGTGFGPRQPIAVAATGAEADEITFGDDTGQGVPQAIFGEDTAVPAADTIRIPLSNIFVGSAQARYEGELRLISMALQGQVQGRVHLEGRETSLGGYVAVGEEVHFLAADGGFSFRWGGGPADIWIKAPGHLSVVISKADVASGQVLTVPELTLPFGDANGDGRIDVLDLSIAATNFGDETRPKPLP
jgi:hypothetical protein